MNSSRAPGRAAWWVGVLWALCVAVFPWTANAQTAVPVLAGHVIDQTATLTPAQRDALEQTLAAFEARKGSQIAVLLVPSTAPEAIEAYALRVAEVWKLGRRKVDDGVVVVVATNDRALRIEVGYGLEGVLTDLTSKRIISETMAPRFQQQDYFGGLTAGVAQMIRVVDGEPLPVPQTPVGFEGVRQMGPVLLVLALVVGGVLRHVLGRVPGAVVTGGVVGVVAWLLAGTLVVALLAAVLALLFTLVGDGWRLLAMGGFQGGGRGGLGGGGFRGGGGGFGGGGASGRW